MGHYEIMFILRPDLEPAQEEEVINGLTDAIEKLEGNIGAVVDWRKRRLAYEIGKYQEGHYFLVYFSGDAEIIPELEHHFRVNDAFIRYLVARVDELAYENAIKGQPEEAEAETEAETEAEAEAETEAEPVTTDDQAVESTGADTEEGPAAVSGKVEKEPSEGQ